jgi:hypothetical protein
MDPLRPPAGIDAATFFSSWLPEAFAGSGTAGLASAPAVRVTLSGPGGGDWRVRADEDGLAVEALASGKHDDVDVWLRQSAADFLAVFDPGPDLPELLPAGWSALDLLFLDERDVALLEQMSGRIALEIAGKRRRRWTLDLAFAKDGISAGRPRATVQIDAATYDGLRAKTMAPMQALLGGKVKIDGDRSLAMKALMLVAARLAR